MSDTSKPAKNTTASDKTFAGFTAEERAAMKGARPRPEEGRAPRRERGRSGR
jgi:hypothetical protein